MNGAVADVATPAGALPAATRTKLAAQAAARWLVLVDTAVSDRDASSASVGSPRMHKFTFSLTMTLVEPASGKIILASTRELQAVGKNIDEALAAYDVSVQQKLLQPVLDELVQRMAPGWDDVDARPTLVVRVRGATATTAAALQNLVASSFKTNRIEGFALEGSELSFRIDVDAEAFATACDGKRVGKRRVEIADVSDAGFGQATAVLNLVP